MFMASRSESYEANRDYRRVSDLKVTEDTKLALEAIAVAHYGQGNLTEFKIGMAALGKVDSLAAITDKVNGIESMIESLSLKFSKASEEG
jgi:hypothetical protein|tara:strand:- start:156 stop:425 length:270 start_codon:yes stop_codon:yes gene_type:complete